MKGFFDEGFFLETETAMRLYHDYAKEKPIIDYHSHVNAHEIADDKHYNNIAEVWLGGDSCRWRLMRWCGVEEKYITGDASDYEKFLAFANALPNAAGNPLYHLTHLELQRYFDCNLPLSPDTAEEIWQICNKTLKRKLSVREMLKLSNVEALCTTVDPADDLEVFSKISNDRKISTKVYPIFSPEKSLAVNKPGFAEYVQKLSDVCGIPILTYDDLLDALASRLDYFVSCGCRLSNHAFDTVPWNFEPIYCDSIFKQAISGERLTALETEAFQTAVMLSLGKEYSTRGVVMQLRYNTLKNVNPVYYRALGSDSGFDCINTNNSNLQLAAYLGALENAGALPKTILYSLNPGDNAILAAMAGAFQQGSVAGRVQHGSTWWFNGAKQGIKSHLTTLAELSALGSFVGMHTDSRGFLSYSRHEYFRRILCDLIGEWIEKGEYRSDIILSGKLVENISYFNAAKFFWVRGNGEGVVAVESGLSS